jgi:L-aspartate oxidase
MVPDLEPQTTAAAAPSLLPLDHPPALPVEPDLLNPSAEPDGLETQTRSQPPALPELPELPRLPRRMAAEQPGWVHEVDVIVVGSGIAGLTAALECRDLGRILVVTKDVVAAGSTNWAQGGIASVQAEGDTVEQHVHDTLVAGAGLCVEEAVRVLVTEGPDEVSKLIARGAEFDRDLAGELELTREGGHHRDRIAHAGGDATGAEIERALIASVRADPAIEIIEHALVLDLIPAEVGPGERPAVAGVTLHVMGEGTRGGVGAIHAGAVVLASGGIGQIYAATTNPPVSTGDGVAAALRAGARLRDIEFIQFHPTVLYLGAGARGQLPLVSEAVRGEGAHLLNAAGERFMVGQHELAELAPRDVVAKGIMKEMAKEGSDHVQLDGRMLGEELWRVRFPNILHSCRRVGIDPVTDLIPVAPACHYFCGGVETDIDGATNLTGLYACGEVASSGVHGANRLASNSLLEGLVFARRIAALLHREPPTRRPPAIDDRVAGLIDRSVVPAMQQAMSRYAGGLRDAAGLDRCAAVLTRLAADGLAVGADVEAGLEGWEATNLMTVATAVVASARTREESRGAHWRSDYEGRRDPWVGHLVVLSGESGLEHEFVPLAVPGAAAPLQPYSQEAGR